MTCVWCGKEWEWDWCNDCVVGIDSLKSLFTSADNPEIKLEVYLCTCGGTLAIVTEETKGSTVMEYRPDEDC